MNGLLICKSQKQNAGKRLVFRIAGNDLSGLEQIRKHFRRNLSMKHSFYRMPGEYDLTTLHAQAPLD